MHRPPASREGGGRHRSACVERVEHVGSDEPERGPGLWERLRRSFVLPGFALAATAALLVVIASLLTLPAYAIQRALRRRHATRVETSAKDA